MVRKKEMSALVTPSPRAVKKEDAVHVEAHDEEAQAVHPESVAGEGQQLRVVAHKDARPHKG